MTSRTARAALAAICLVATAATAGCGSLDETVDSVLGPQPTATTITYPASVTGPGSVMSKKGCEEFKDDKNKPLECVATQKERAYLYLTTSGKTYGKQEYVPVDQFEATCTKVNTTVTGPDGIKLIFTRGSRDVQVFQGETSIGSYEDQFLRWPDHLTVMTNGTSKVGAGELSVSLRAVCAQPMTKEPSPSPSV